jgi:predicted dehydrogenase
VADADAMIGAADSAGTVLMCAHNLRFASPFVAIAQAVARGDVGTVLSVRSAFGHGGPHGWAPDATWFYDPARSGGGALIDLGIHMADVLHFVLGERVTEVAAALSGGGAVEDAAQLLLRFAGGAIGTLHASWVVSPGRDLALDVFGSDGTIRFDGRGRPSLERADGGEAEELRATTPEGEERPDLYRGFARAIETGGPPPVTARDGRDALAVVEAAYASAATGGFSQTA